MWSVDRKQPTSRINEQTFSSLSSYGKFATITLILEGTPSSGGPRLLLALNPPWASVAVTAGCGASVPAVAVVAAVAADAAGA